jgi:hypothetical protein
VEVRLSFMHILGYSSVVRTVLAEACTESSFQYKAQWYNIKAINLIICHDSDICRIHKANSVSRSGII